MAKVWDDRLKCLAGMVPQDFIKWLLPDAHLVRPVVLELKTLTRTVSTDILFEVRIHGKKALVHIEFQRCANAKMVERVWEYNVLATLAHHCPVYSFVIYLVPGGEIPESPLAFSLASMVLTSESDQQWLEGEVAMLEDILRDTWFYQKILKEGEEKGHEKEQKRELQTLGQILVSSVEVNFPSLVPLARRCAETIHDTEGLKKTTLQVVSTKDIDMARNHLLVALEEQ